MMTVNILPSLESSEVPFQASDLPLLRTIEQQLTQEQESSLCLAQCLLQVRSMIRSIESVRFLSQAESGGQSNAKDTK
jgi:hypothetical protein